MFLLSGEVFEEGIGAVGYPMHGATSLIIQEDENTG